MMLLNNLTWLQALFTNRILLFTVCRYIVYVLLFTRGMLLANFLGPYLFGTFGFLNMIIQYLLVICSFGLQYAITVQLSKESNLTSEASQKFISSALLMTIIIACFLGLAGLSIHFFNTPVFEKYYFNQYSIIIGLNGGLSLVMLVLVNTHRAYGSLARIAMAEFSTAIIMLIVIFAFRGDGLLVSALVGLTICGLLNITILMLRTPFKLTFQFDLSAAKQLLLIGFPLLISNTSFIMIALSAQSVVSYYYSVQVMGYYTLANNITTAVLLGFNSISWVVFPDILSKVRHGTDDHDVVVLVQRINHIYGTAVFLSVFFIILALPGLYWFLPQYKPVHGTLTILLLSQAVISYGLGNNCLAIAREKQLAIAKISLMVVIVVAGFSLAAGFYQIDIIWIAITLLFGSIVFTLLQNTVSSGLIANKINKEELSRGNCSLGTYVAIFLMIMGNMIGYADIGAALSLSVYLIANRKNVILLWFYCIQMVSQRKISQG